MLPGLRFLFATVILAASVLIFAVGAAALLRAAHEEFASLPSWRLAQQPPLLVPQPEAPPRLAVLRVETPPPAVPVPPPAAVQETPVAPAAARLETRPDAAAPVPAEPVRDAAQTAPDAPAPTATAALTSPDSTEQPASAPETPLGAAEAVESHDTEAAAPVVTPVEPLPSTTEASEPKSVEALTAAARSSEATASMTIPAVKKATSSRAVAARRRAIARARAEARARALQQQQLHNSGFPLLGGG